MLCFFTNYHSGHQVKKTDGQGVYHDWGIVEVHTEF